MDESFHGASFGASVTFLIVVLQAKDRREKVIILVTVFLMAVLYITAGQR